MDFKLSSPKFIETSRNILFYQRMSQEKSEKQVSDDFGKVERIFL